MKWRNMFRPKTVNMRPSRMRAMRMAIFMGKLSFGCLSEKPETCITIVCLGSVRL